MHVRTTALALIAITWGAQAAAQVTFYARENFEGPAFTTQQYVPHLERRFDDRASSAVVTSNRWEVCEEPEFRGRCVVLRRGSYPSLAAMGIDNQISSVRALRQNVRVDDSRYAPSPLISGDFRRRHNERLFEAEVTAVRAVMGPPERRCWVERQQVVEDHGRSNVPGAIAGAVLGGILGHQVGGGSGRDIATGVGAVAGAAAGSRINSRDERVGYRDVQRCSEVPAGARPSHYDVTYRFRGQEHTMQTTTPPGATVTVNRLGEPRAA
ncbi:glycine zipper 2TM domain-containing protein [Aquincola sp. S2]|uniref:Glycine zipper 2TM domain-containing protein n=1 Tax=Pseudaquabacterium terrae TaxID=2732868 RepID=A0ABX2EER5_9BURK|nr:beta/gamma crystallin-related protein [Aquabacterium terrae]NRF67115.1 glycine zipper 2TM domain-containing protein [Aquabacterium terrae]